MEQPICLRVLRFEWNSCAEYLKMLQKAYSVQVLFKIQAYEWSFVNPQCIFDHKRNGNYRPSTVFAGFGLGRLFAVSETQFVTS